MTAQRLPLKEKVKTARALPSLYKLYKPAGRANPYPLVKRVQKIAPLIYVPNHTFITTRYDEAAAILRDPRFASNLDTRHRRPGFDVEAMKKFHEEHTGPRFRNTMIFRDGEDHERLRGLVSRAFTPRMIASLGPRIERVTDELLDVIEEKGSVDLVADLAYPLPVTIICEMLGVPVFDQHLFRGWTALLARALDPSMNTADAEDIVRAADKAADAFGGYLTDLIERRRREPGEDLLSALIEASDEGDRLTTDEVLHTCLLLLVAGHETTTNLIGSGMLTLLKHPDQLASLRADLSPERVRVAIEELLRFDPPVVAVLRVAAEDITIGKTTIPQGWDAILIIPGANRDPRRFPDPHRLDLERQDNRHLSFSGGPHFCLGAPLARLEGQIAITKLLQRFPSIHLETDTPEWRETITLRSLKELPVSVGTSL